MSEFNMSEYVQKYNKEKYDEIRVRIPKGRKSEWKIAADKAGQSVNAYITQAVENRIESETP